MRLRRKNFDRSRSPRPDCTGRQPSHASGGVDERARTAPLACHQDRAVISILRPSLSSSSARGSVIPHENPLQSAAMRQLASRINDGLSG